MTFTRIQLRRGTSSEWSSSNPILAPGEAGFETDTGKFKVGNGSSNWTALEYFANADAITSGLIDSAPEALNTLNELAAALGDDENFSTTVLNQISLKAPLESPTFTGTADFSNATLSGITLPINWTGEFSNSETYLENDMVHYQGSVYYATGPNLNNADGYFPTAPGANWELFASKGDQGETGLTGPEGPEGPAGVVPDQVLSPISSINYTIQSSDLDKFLYSTDNVQSLTYINIANVLQPGGQIDFMQFGSANLVIQPTSGVSLFSSTRPTSGPVKLFARYSVASVKCISSNNYIVYGEIISA
jgi:hypothetical protein